METTEAKRRVQQVVVQLFPEAELNLSVIFIISSSW